MDDIDEGKPIREKTIRASGTVGKRQEERKEEQRNERFTTSAKIASLLHTTRTRPSWKLRPRCVNPVGGNP